MQKPGYGDKILPNQDFFRYLYHDDAPFETALHSLISGYARKFDAARFDLITPKNVDFEEMSTPPGQLALMATIIHLIGAKTVLEIGSFIGNSAMQFARMVGKGGHVTTIEVGQEFADLARENFRRNGFESQITLHLGNAGRILTGLPAQSFDLIFIDGSKQDYLDYALKSEKLLTSRGVIMIDDVFFHGDALNSAPATDKGRGCKALLDHYQTAERFEHLLLPVSNGILMLYRRG
jgi:predicted O-methyltransferase YrrM